MPIEPRYKMSSEYYPVSKLFVLVMNDIIGHCNALIEYFRQKIDADPSNTLVSDMDVLSWQKQTLNLIGPESLSLRGKRDIFVSFLAWFLYHGYY